MAARRQGRRDLRGIVARYPKSSELGPQLECGKAIFPDACPLAVGPDGHLEWSPGPSSWPSHQDRGGVSATKRKSRSWGQHDRLRKVPVALGGRPRRVIVGVYERILRRRPPITCRSSAEKHSRSGLQHKVSGGKQGVSASRQPGRAVRTTGSFRCKICFTFAAPVVADADRLPALRARD